MGKGWTEDSQQLAVRELEKLRDQGFEPMAVIENVVRNGWRGIYPPKGQTGAKARAQSTAEHNDAAFAEFLSNDDDGRTIDAGR